MADKEISDRFFLLGSAPGGGGLSEVRKAFDRSQPEGGYAAIKLLRDNDEVIRIFLERQTEARLALRQPHIVRMLDCGWDEELGRYFVALEWLDRSLKDETEGGRPMAWPVFFEKIGQPLAGASAHAHGREVEHRDIKPSNVLITQDGTLKLADFGIAKIRSKVEVTDQAVAGYRSDLYAPPERADAIPCVRDVFSCGVLAVQVLSGGQARDYPYLAPDVDGPDIASEDWRKAKAAVLADLSARVHADLAYNAQAKETDRDALWVVGNSLFLRLRRWRRLLDAREEASAGGPNLAHFEEHLTALDQQPPSEHTTSARELGERIVDARHRHDMLREQRHELYPKAQVIGGTALGFLAQAALDLPATQAQLVQQITANINYFLGLDSAGRGRVATPLGLAGGKR